ncbi:C40 family peptidase [Streptomyces amakusaensis]|uniref:NlpC/P60 family protein n=1 Tax=Streptomyces amakusaensis TaxID=67271 RepID=A0ABW0AT75_9ACTN
MNRRRCAIAALTVLCALAVPASSGMASASPLSPRTAGAPAAPLLPRAPEPPDRAGESAEDSLDRVRVEIEGLYHQAVSATDAYNLAEEEAERQSAEITALAQRTADGQKRIQELKDRAGATARAQYRGGGLPAEAQLVLTDDPRLFLDGVDRVKQGMKATKDLLRDLERAQSELKTYAHDAGARWRALEATRVTRDKAKKEITEKIAAAEKMERRLEKKERARLLELEREAAEKAQARWLESRERERAAAAGTADSPTAGGDTSGDTSGETADGWDGGASGQGAKAVKFASAQLGKPYGWGDEGPGSYDCSGLTSQAWASAGRTIPRTSQQQWRQLPRVTVEDMRPGDLIIYHADASHVGMYIGDGSIVHAPRPGRNVSVAGAGSMKILGVVRPDK